MSDTIAVLLRGRRSRTGLEGERPLLGSVVFDFYALALGVGAVLVVAAGGRYLGGLVAIGASYLVAALGYNLVLGYAGQLAFGHAGFLAVGAYGFAILQANGVPWIFAFVAGTVAAGVTAAVIGAAVLRTSHFYLALVTLAFAEAMLVIIRLWPATGGDDGMSVDLLGREVAYLAIGIAVLALVCSDRLVRSRLGRAFLMVRSDEATAAAMGVPVARTRVIGFVVSGVYGGIGGILLAGSLRFVTPDNFGMDITLLMLAMIVVGGLGSLGGTVLGTALFVALPQLLGVALGFQNIVYGVILFIVVAALPRGLVSFLGAARRAFDRIHESRGWPRPPAAGDTDPQGRPQERPAR